MKNAVFCYVTQFLCSVLRLLVKANVPTSPILVTLMMEALRTFETPVLTGATRRKIPEDGILHESYVKLFLPEPTSL
jgi:hypothetical protein